jgi:hypothetical protein
MSLLFSATAVTDCKSRAGGVAQAVRAPAKCEALNSNPSAAKKEDTESIPLLSAEPTQGFSILPKVELSEAALELRRKVRYW